MFRGLLCLLVQVNFAFGLAGFLWPEKMMPFYGVLMFPWAANHRVIRANGVLAFVAYLVVLGKILLIGL